jgi:uncharacterized protein
LIWAVLDTNVIVSGMALGGIPGRVVDLGIQGHFIIVTSPVLLQELARVLQYQKLAAFFDDPLSTLLLVERASVVVEPTMRVNLLADDPDNRLIEAALMSNADFLVTGDQKLLDLRTCNGTGIVRPREFLESLGSVPPDEERSR